MNVCTRLFPQQTFEFKRNQKVVENLTAHYDPIKSLNTTEMPVKTIIFAKWLN